MGRYTSDTGGTDQPRKKTIKLFASDAAVPVPAWAGVVYVTGCGGGNSGAVQTSGLRGAGGLASAFVIRWPVPILAPDTTIAVVIGAGGAAVSATAAVAGNSGGKTTVQVGNVVLDIGTDIVVGVGSVMRINGQTQDSPGLPGGRSGLAQGGPVGSTAGAGQGQPSPFGGNPVQTAAIVAGTSTTAQTPVGFGAGGDGAYTNGATPGVSGPGGDGFVLLEFEEIV